VVFVFGVAIFLLISGSFSITCAGGEDSAPNQSSIRVEVEQQYLEDAIGAFSAGDFGRARSVFDMLSESAQSAEVSRQALFGLASSKLVLARTPEEYEDALSTWKKWSERSNSVKGCEDPRLLTPFLQRLQSSIKDAGVCLPHGAQGGRASREPGGRGILQCKEKEMQSLRSKLELREREVRRLRHQLESLEEIHRKYQEKKQEATPASPAPPR
jgi:hypothetical protein